MFIPKCYKFRISESSLQPTNQQISLLRFPSTSININTQHFRVLHQYISTSMSYKYHRSQPQSIFKSCHFPCVDISADTLRSAWRAAGKWWLSLWACMVNHHYSFRCHIWFSTCWLSWFLRPVWHIHSLSVVICLDVHWRKVPAQVQNNIVGLVGTWHWAKATFIEVMYSFGQE